MFTESEKRIIALAHSIIARRFTRLDSLNSHRDGGRVSENPLRHTGT